VLICVPTDACDPNRVQTLVPDIELQDVGCVIGPVDVNGDGIHDLAVDTRVYFGPISADTINSRSPDVYFFQGHSDTSHAAVKAYEDLNGDGYIDAIMSFEDTHATYRYNPLMVVWGPLPGRICVDLCPVSPEVADSPLCPSGRNSNCQCNVDKDASTPAVCVYRDEAFNFEFSQFVGGPSDFNGAGCKLPDGLLTGDVNGDGYTDIIHVVHCDPNDRTCEFSRIRIDLGPNTPDSDSCFLNPGVSVCEVEFDIPRVLNSADVYLVKDIDGNGSDEFCVWRGFSDNGDDVHELYLGPINIEGFTDGLAILLPGYYRGSYYKYTNVGNVGLSGNAVLALSQQVVSEIDVVFVPRNQISNSHHEYLRISGDARCRGLVARVGDIDADGLDDLLFMCQKYYLTASERAGGVQFYGPVVPGQWDYRMADSYFELAEFITPVDSFVALGDVSGDDRADWGFMVGDGTLARPLDLWIQFGTPRRRR